MFAEGRCEIECNKIAQTRPRLAEDQMKNVKSKTHCCHFMVSCDAHKLFSTVASLFFEKLFAQKTATTKINCNKQCTCTVYTMCHIHFGYHLNDWYIRFLYLILEFCFILSFLLSHFENVRIIYICIAIV